MDMPKKTPQRRRGELVTRGILEDTLEEVLAVTLTEHTQKILAVVELQGKRLEAKIDFSRQDAKEQLEAVDRRLTRRMDKLEHEVVELQQDVTGLKQDVTGLKQDVTGLKQDVTGLKRDVNSLNRGLQVTQAAVFETRDLLKPHSSQLANHETRITHLEAVATP